jgi:hypothetical protein
LPRSTRVREYELADVIGEAGFAIVYRAWDTTLQPQRRGQGIPAALDGDCAGPARPR